MKNILTQYIVGAIIIKYAAQRGFKLYSTIAGE